MVETESTPHESQLIEASAARRLVGDLFRAMDVPADDSELVAEVLVSADLRGINSHGLARVPYFLIRLERGVIVPRPDLRFTTNTATTGLLDAGNGIGIVAAERAMSEAIGMASAHGAGFVVVKDSSHFGYAGFWSDLAMRVGMIGISMSNSGGRVAPTFGAESILGTNPLAVSIPGAPDGTDFSLDMATSAVAVGKVETALREGREPPPGWVASTNRPTLDANGALTFAAPLVPLGGEGTETGGHKGYGLALLVELMCGALGGTGFDARIAGASGESPPAMGHLMGALDIEGFRPLVEVQSDMEATFDRIRDSTKTSGHDRILIAGEPETLAEQAHRENGIAVPPPVMAQLEKWSARLGVAPIS